jgi:mRNA interferase RelE/StbE
MKYRVEIAKKAKKELDSLPINTQENIAEGIGRLGNNPDDPALDVKKLKNDPEADYRLRVGSYRIKFNRHNTIKIISIIRVVHRKDAYK